MDSKPKPNAKANELEPTGKLADLAKLKDAINKTKKAVDAPVNKASADHTLHVEDDNEGSD
ncbi:MAG: hypothetical protein JRD69_09840 [Deltaproteobacteria bacterium]|nr:hypothetical protein [Deltaproteobacteria bacterium]